MPEVPLEWCLLKEDLLGRVERSDFTVPGDRVRHVRRITSVAPAWLRPLARHLASREARALHRLDGLISVPKLVSFDGRVLVRTWIAGTPLHQARPPGPEFFEKASLLLGEIHAAGIAHNDLAKEPNILITEKGEPAFVDFQLATAGKLTSSFFCLLVREDQRHLLKHKRVYCPEALTSGESELLQQPSLIARLWRVTGKKINLLVTRGFLGWADREGAGDRGGINESL